MSFFLQLSPFLLCQLLTVWPQGVLGLKNKPTINLLMFPAQTPILQGNSISKTGKQLTGYHSESPRCSGAKKSQISKLGPHSPVHWSPKLFYQYWRWQIIQDCNHAPCPAPSSLLFSTPSMGCVFMSHYSVATAATRHWPPSEAASPKGETDWQTCHCGHGP